MRRLIVLMVAMALVGCGANAEKQIIGRWQSEDGDVTLTFTPDGTMYFEGATAFDCYSIDGDQLKIVVGSSGDDAPLTVTFDGADTMKTSGPGGDRVYKRLNSTGTLSPEANQLKISNALDGKAAPACPAP